MPRAFRTSVSFLTTEPLFRSLRAGLLMALLAALISAVFAQEGLYGPEAPRDVAYLRVINARLEEAVTPVVGGEEWQPVEFAQVSPYRQLPPGEHPLRLGETELTVTARPESFTTVALLEDQVVTIADTPLRDISRGLLSLYNLTSQQTLSLSTADGTPVVSGVEPHAARSRAISQAEVGLVVTSNGERVGSLEARLYRRGEAHSVIVLPVGSESRVIYARAAAER